MITPGGGIERGLDVRLFSTSERIGGAAIAAYRLHDALVRAGHTSRLHVAERQSDAWRVIAPMGRGPRLAGRLRAAADRLPLALQRTANPIMHSPAVMSSVRAATINALGADVVNLHWIVNGFLSIEEIGRIRAPLVWTLHDSWAFCGAEHHPDWRGDTRFRDGYTDSNRLDGSAGLDVDRWVWKRKMRAWTEPFCVVAPSEWLASAARSSALFRRHPVSVIPNVLATDVFRPVECRVAREILRLPPDGLVVLFGAMGGGYLKGWDLLQPALSQVGARVAGTVGVIFGMSEPEHPPTLGMPLHWMGQVHDETTRALLYSAADVTVVPSRQEAFGQTGSEAQACGCPVVAFGATGLLDVVAHGETGYLAEPFSSKDLAQGIEWVLTGGQRADLGRRARKRAVLLWSPEVVVPRYEAIFHQAIELRGGGGA